MEKNQNIIVDMWKFAYGLTVARRKNRLDTLDVKSNRKYVDNIAELLSILVIHVHIIKWKSTIYGTELANSGA